MAKEAHTRNGLVKANFWLSKEEKELLVQTAARKGVTMSRLIKDLILRNAMKEGMTKSE